MKKQFAVIGNPVQHSLSPTMHNAAFKALEIKAVYSAVTLAADELPLFFNRMRAGAFDGVNITIPYKQKVFDLVDTLTADAEQTGAVNTVYRQDNRLVATNTDGAGFINSLLADTALDPTEKNCVIIGAGGACHAIAFALCKRGIAALTLINRDPNKAAGLSYRLKARFNKINVSTACFADLSRVLPQADLLINTTPLGTPGIPWPEVTFVDHLSPRAVVSDIVYNPADTPLLVKAQDRGLITHSGIGMLVHQGALAFELFTGLKAPINIMRGAIT
ncbi:MAG: shikimate dehydrogenase [Deltaproteobacteria bacterium]|nr:shikimate dehydrogenase [Deltaproteobacteria bacterium]